MAVASNDPIDRSPQLILNLAVADLLFVVICVPSTGTIYALPHDWPYGDVW